MMNVYHRGPAIPRRDEQIIEAWDHVHFAHRVLKSTDVHEDLEWSEPVWAVQMRLTNGEVAIFALPQAKAKCAEMPSLALSFAHKMEMPVVSMGPPVSIETGWPREWTLARVRVIFAGPPVARA